MARQRRGKMKTVVLEVRSLRESLADIVRVVKMRGGDHEARISFASPELLWQVLTAKRWEILKAMCGVGPMSIRDAARRVERDVKAVHSDVTALLTAGVLRRTDDSRTENFQSLHTKAATECGYSRLMIVNEWVHSACLGITTTATTSGVAWCLANWSRCSWPYTPARRWPAGL